MATPAIIELIIQKDIGDCAIAALAMVLGIPYAEVCHTALELYPASSSAGLTTRQMLAVTRKLGRNLQSIPIQEVQLDAETGILDVRIKRRYHAVVLFEGVVVNPADGLIYNLDTYLAARKATPSRFFRP